MNWAAPMRIGRMASLAHLQRRIRWLIPVAIAAVLLPVAALTSYERDAAGQSRRVIDFHLASAQAIRDAIVTVDDIRLDRTVVDTSSSPAARAQLVELRLALNQLRLLHEDEAGSTLLRADERARTLAWVVGPLLLLLAGGGVVAANRVRRGIGQDLDEDRDARAELARSREMLSLVFDTTNALQVLVAVEPDGRFLVEAANAPYRRELERLFPGHGLEVVGLDRTEMLTRLGLPRDLAERELPRYREAAEHRQPVHYDISLPGPDGNTMLEVTIAPILGGDGRCTHLLWCGRDVTVRRTTERALTSFKATLDQTRDCVFMFWADSLRFFYANQGAIEQVGYTAEEMYGMTPLDIKPEFDERSLRGLFEPLLTGGRPSVNFETVHRHKNGGDLPVEVFVQYFPAGEEPAHFIAIVRDITERRRTERILRESHRQLHRIFESVSFSVGVLSLDGTLIEVNRVPLDETGRQRTDIVGHTVWDSESFAGMPASQDQLRDAVDRASKGERIRCELPIRRRDSIRTLDVTFGPLRNDADDVVQIVVSAVDITDRQHAEQALRLSERSLRDAQRIGHLGSLDLNLKSGELRLSEETLKIFGLDKSDTTLDEVVALLHPDDAARVQKSLRDAATGIATHDLEHRMVRPDGSLVFVRATAELFRDVHGAPDRLLGTVIDITDRQHAEQALRLSERSLRDAQRIAHVGNWDWNITTDALAWSDEIYRIFGRPTRSLPATYAAFLETVHPDDRPLVVDGVAAALRRERPYDVEHRIVRPNGEVRVVHEQGEVAFANDGRPTRMVGTVLDITAYRQAEQRLAELNAHLEQRVAERTAQLEASNHELEAFSYSVSHDLRAPLRAIDGFSQALLEDWRERLDATAVEYLTRVRQGTERMGALIDDMMRLSKVTRSGMQIEPVDLSALARQVASELAAADPARQVTVEIQPTPLASGDSQLLRAALVNLLGNAWKFTRDQPHAIVEFGATGAGADLAFYVRDNGAGFDMAYAGKLFGAFQRLHSSHEFEGNGIGLATVQRIIRRHGGRLWAEGEVGRGATFHFTLPLASRK